MADENTVQPTTPPTMPEYDYQTNRASIPIEQMLYFCTNLAEGSYLPSAYTTDEDKHLLPDGLMQMLVDGRKLQHAWIKRGNTGNQTFDMQFITRQADWEDFTKYVADGNSLIDKLVSFEGTDAGGSYIRSDVGINSTQASLGLLSWKPEAVIAQTPGHYQSAHFIIETPDRTRAITTLDFDLEIIGDSPDADYSPRYQFYISEFQRSLYEVSYLMKAGQDQLAYQTAIYTAIVKKKIDDMQEQMAAAKKQIDDTVDYGKSSIDSMIKAGNTKLDSFLADVTDKLKLSNDELNKLLAQIDSSDLLTKGNAGSILQEIIESGGIIIGSSDDDTDEELLQMKKEIEEANK